VLRDNGEAFCTFGRIQMTFMTDVPWRGDERVVIGRCGLNVVASLGGSSEKP